MKLQQLHVFVTVILEKSLRGAARRLNLTQPAITRTIQELELDLGVSLFSRSVKGIELTEFGAALQNRANQLLEDARRAREELQQLKGEIRGKICFGTSSSIAITLLPMALRRFRESAPGVNLEVVGVNLQPALQRISDGSLDFVATHVLHEDIDEHFESVPLLASDFVVMGRAGHPLAKARSLGELVDAEWLQPISVESGEASVMRLAFSLHRLQTPANITRYSSLAVAIGLLMGSDSLTLMSRPLAKHMEVHGLETIQLDTPLPQIQMSVIMRKNQLLTSAARHFVACLQNAAIDLQSNEIALLRPTTPSKKIVRRA